MSKKLLHPLFCITFFTFILLPFKATGQQQLEGRVFNAKTNAPLEGASIITLDNNGTSSDENGEFMLPCAEKIIVSYIGYKTAEIKIEDCSKYLTIGLIPTSISLKELEITATSASNKVLLVQPRSIVKLNKKEINRGTGVFLYDAINSNVPGVIMSRRGVASGQQINIRGYGNGMGFKGISNNFDTRGTKIYLNGIPLTNAEGITVLDGIDFASIGNVEIIKGPAGTLYGLAIAGVVNLHTVKPEPGTTTLGQKVLVGDYGLRRYTTYFQMGGQNSSLLVNYGHQGADGYMKHTASEKDFVNIVANFQPKEKQEINAYFGYFNSYDGRGGELTIEQYREKDYSGNMRYIKNNAHSEVIGFRAGLGHSYIFGPHIVNHTTVFVSSASTNSSFAAGWNDGNHVNYGLRSTLKFDFTLKGDFRLNGIAGVEAQKQKSHPLGYGMVPDSSDLEGYNVIGGLRSNVVSNSRTYSYFTQWTLDLPQNFSLTAGVGISNMHISLDKRIYNPSSSFPTRYETEYNNLISPHLAINKVFNENLSLYATYSVGYRPPVSSNIVISATGELNTGLKPEKGQQFEIGTKGNLFSGKLHYQLAFFHAIFSNKLTAVAVPLDNTTTAYTYLINGGEQTDNGLEVMASYTAFQSYTAFFSFIRPWANITYSDFTYNNFTYQRIPRGSNDIITETYDGNAVAGVSPITTNVGIDFAIKYGFYGNVNYRYKDAMPITSNGKFMTEAYSVLNAKIGYQHQLGNHFKLDLFAGANNITSTQYYYMVFINQLPDVYLPAPYKTNYFTGFNLEYIF